MKEKFFTPNIEDIHVGYECEYQDNYGFESFNNGEETWIPIKIKLKDDEGAYTSQLEDILIGMDDGYQPVRVPYLTKEQIEAEGWYKINNNYPIQTFKHPIDVDVEVIYNYDTNYLFITIPGKIMFTEPNIEYRANKFSGECKDINTFRKIIKLLGI